VRKRIGPVEIDTITAESPKFTASLLLVHGLWCTSTVWYRAMGYLAHRGWDSHALNLRGRNPRAGDDFHLDDHLADLNAVIRACDAPPVLIGHDLGGLLVLAAGLAPVRAVVALAPLLPTSLRQNPIPAIGGTRTRLTMALRGHLPPPSGRRSALYFGDVRPHPLTAESPGVAEDLLDPRSIFRIGVQAPTLIVAGERDEVVSLVTIEELSHAIGAELLKVAGVGHALPWAQGWQDRVAEIHRWLIRTLGDPLLALLDEEESQ
jgi:non-heme chloroperoxidase